MPSHPTALVIEPVLPHLISILGTLSALGFDVTVAETFRDAKDSVIAQRPSLLLTDVRLQDYNGIHLVLRARAIWPDLPALVTSEIADTVLQDETEKLKATFLMMPTTSGEIVAAVYRTLFRPMNARSEPIRAPFERRHFERRSQSGELAGPERRSQDRRREPRERLEKLATAI